MSKATTQLTMFAHEDLPLFSGTAPTAKVDVFTPKAAHQQTSLAECPICLDTGTVDSKPCWCKADPIGRCSDYAKAADVITTDKSKARIVCDLCGRMYTRRPLICLCASNCFLSPVTASGPEECRP